LLLLADIVEFLLGRGLCNEIVNASFGRDRCCRDGVIAVTITVLIPMARKAAVLALISGLMISLR
jgi:hypothetical protein